MDTGLSGKFLCIHYNGKTFETPLFNRNDIFNSDVFFSVYLNEEVFYVPVFTEDLVKDYINSIYLKLRCNNNKYSMIFEEWSKDYINNDIVQATSTRYIGYSSGWTSCFTISVSQLSICRYAMKYYYDIYFLPAFTRTL